jgi:hypothetical protein
MQSNRSNTLGGEGCPAADIEKPAGNRNICDDLYGHPSLIPAIPRRTLQEQTGSADTPLAQQTEFSVRDVLEAFEAWADRQVFTPDEVQRVHSVIGYLIMSEREGPLPAPLRAKMAEHVAALARQP